MGLIALLLTCSLMHPVVEIEDGLLHPMQTQDAGVLPMLIYFSSDDCTACAQFDAMFEEPEMLRKMEQHYVSVRVSIDESDGKVCADIYHVEEVPAFVIADHEGIILYKSNATLSVGDIQLLFDALPGEFPSVKAPEPSPANERVENTQRPTETHQPIVSDNAVGEQPSINSTSVAISKAREDGTETPLTGSRKSQESAIPGTKRAIVNSSPTTNNGEITKVNVKVGDSQEKTLKPKDEPPIAIAHKKPLKRFTYSIQLGFFSEAPNAKTLTQKAKLKGLADTRTQTELRDGKSYYRVLAGNYSTLTEAQNLLAEVHALGLKGAVHRQ